LVSSFLDALEEAYSNGEEEQIEQPATNEADEEAEEDYGQEEDYEDGDADYFDDFQLSITKQDDLEYLRYNRVKAKSKSTRATPEESKQVRERLA